MPQQVPNPGGGRIAQQDGIIVGQRPGGAPRHAGQRLGIELRQQETADLAQPRSRQRRVGQRKAGQALVRWQGLRLRGQRHMNTVAHIGDTACPERRWVRPDQPDEATAGFQNADLRDTRR